MEELLIKYISGDITTQEREQVVKWISESHEHRQEYDALRKMYTAVLWQDDTTIKNTTKTKSAIKPIFRELVKIAAVFVVAIFLVQGWNYLFPGATKEEVIMQQLHVPPGQRVELTLVDGTHVWLNANTHFSFPNRFDDGKREIFLNGEARFEVTSDAANPFIVKTSRHNIEVLGTKFNVLAYEQENIFETALMEGKVKVSANKGNPQILQPNTKITDIGGTMKISTINNPDYYRWTEGLLCFENETIEDLFKKLQTYFNIEIEINNTKILKRRYSGKFWIDDGVDHILGVLQLNNEFTYNRDMNERKYIIN